MHVNHATQDTIALVQEKYHPPPKIKNVLLGIVGLLVLQNRNAGPYARQDIIVLQAEQMLAPERLSSRTLSMPWNAVLEITVEAEELRHNRSPPVLTDMAATIQILLLATTLLVLLDTIVLVG